MAVITITIPDTISDIPDTNQGQRGDSIQFTPEYIEWAQNTKPELKVTVVQELWSKKTPVWTPEKDKRS